MMCSVIRMTFDILLVEDNPAVAEGLKSLLEGLASVSRVRVAGSFTEALAAARSWQFDIAILDYLLPDATGVDVALELRRLSPETKLAILSVVERPRSEEGLRAVGIEGWFTKSDSVAELIRFVEDRTPAS